MAGTVFVSGGSGYIAGFLIRQLIDAGWTVHTSIRDLAKESAIRATLAVDNSKLKFFAADLTSDAGWAEAMATRPDACLACGSGDLRTEKLKEVMVRLAERQALEVEIVEHSDVLMALGGVGCLLRYATNDTANEP